MSTFRRMPVPYVIERLEDGRAIRVQWEEQGHVAVYSARDLRLACACAGCVEEMSGRPLLDPDSVPGDVRAVAIALVGQYAVRFAWSDGHDSGIYAFDRLLALCPCDACAAKREAAG